MADVQDPSDFPEHAEAPGLRLLDSALRCTICSELFDGPVTLKCGHCFCSLCIRQSLIEKQECPACREEDTEFHLRRNTVMEEAVVAWRDCRPFLLQIMNQRRDVEQPRPSKKRRLNAHFEEPPSSEPSSEASTTFDIHHPTSNEDEPDKLVSCPSCSKRVKMTYINHHLDNGCKDAQHTPAPSSKAQWENILGSKSQVGKSPKKKKGKDRASSDEEDYPLPKKSYDTLKDKAIKELLQEHDLPITGDRKTLVVRHQRWVIIYNSNLDKARNLRKSIPALRRELRDWETLQKNRTKHNIDPVTHQIKQKAEFDKLVEAARPNKSSSSDQMSTPRPQRRNSSPSVENVILVDSDDDEG
ncbi:hypothetical protein BDP27DRAFT_1417643 [Rhodocollybia butyracea]|uniref:Postreplication repair E3 ubiquitin-protein ligase RAD18 n=1 Tax=Rhodocollybia butyracea TaxID=206335 RepID=A0A9P5Q0L8_9AGAR|nr:hypothetical protein BDP27DRAFT_1417643 [Rhodocollybia butyracea]